MSGGGTNYPSPILGGFWNGQNAQYGPYVNSNQPGLAMSSAATDIGNISNYSNPAGFSGAGNNALSFVKPALNQGFDPQKRLYDKLFQQQQNQNRAEQATAGVAATPYGSGLTTQGNEDFNLAWQNAQLGREATAAQTAGNLIGAATQGQQSAIAPGQQQIQDWLNYYNTGLGGLNSYWQSVLNAFGNTNNLYGTQGQLNQNQQQLNNAGYGGLANLGGTLLGYGLFG